MELNRRQFTIAFAAASVATASFVSKMNAIAEAMPKAPWNRMDKFGKITTKTHSFKVRVFLDGVDVTDDGFEADDIAGYVDCWIRGGMCASRRTGDQFHRPTRLQSCRRK